MKFFLDCMPCMLKQALEAARMVTDSEEKQDVIMGEAMKFMVKYKSYRNSPELARDIHRMIREITGNPDPYLEIKEKDLNAAKEFYPCLKDFVMKQENRLYWALKAAATGNNLDSAIYFNQNPFLYIEEELNKKFALCDIDIFREKLEKAETILILGDNTGETVFDKLLIENLQHHVIYAVRSGPVLNDATEREACLSGLDQVSKIISTGCNAPGVILEDCSPEFIDIYKNADIIISKGQGNFETLSGEKGNLFFLLKAKCPIVAERLQVQLNDYVFKSVESKG